MVGTRLPCKVFFFPHGLSDTIKDELAPCDEPVSLGTFISLANWMDNFVTEKDSAAHRETSKGASSSELESMPVGCAQLSAEERRLRIQDNTAARPAIIFPPALCIQQKGRANSRSVVSCPRTQLQAIL